MEIIPTLVKYMGTYFQSLKCSRPYQVVQKTQERHYHKSTSSDSIAKT